MSSLRVRKVWTMVALLGELDCSTLVEGVRVGRGGSSRCRKEALQLNWQGVMSLKSLAA